MIINCRLSFYSFENIKRLSKSHSIRIDYDEKEINGSLLYK